MTDEIRQRLDSLKNTSDCIASLGAAFVYDVGKRIESLGYTMIIGDEWMIGFVIQKVEGHIRNECNTNTIPEGLLKTAIDMIVGEFLFCKKNMGQLTGLDLEPVVKSIQEGDTNITFSVGSGSMTPEERINTLISFLMHSEADFASYRCIKW
jgi:hypothetical protein